MYRRARKSVVMQTMGHQLVRRHSDVATLPHQPFESQLTTQEQPPSGDGSSEESSSGISSSGVSFSSDCSSPGSRVTAILAETESLPSSRVSHRRSIPMDYRLLAGMRSMSKVPAPVHSSENRKRKTTSENPPSPVDTAVKKSKIIDDSCRSPSKTASVTTLWNKDTDASLARANNECEKCPLLPSASHCENECAVVDNRVVMASDVPLMAADCVSVSVEDCANDADCCAKENRPMSVLHSQKNSMEACYGVNRPTDCRCADNKEEELDSTTVYKNSDSVSDIVPGDPHPVKASTDCELQDKNCCLVSDEPLDGGSCSSSGDGDHEKLNCPSDVEHASQRSHISRLFSSVDLRSTSFTADNLQLCKEHEDGGSVTELKESCGLSDAVRASQHSDMKKKLFTMPNMTDYCLSENTFLKSYLGFCLQGSAVLPSTSSERTVKCGLVESVRESPNVSPTEPSRLSSHCDSEFSASCSAVIASQSSAGAMMPANHIERFNDDFKRSSETLKPPDTTEKLSNVDCNLDINDVTKFSEDCDELANTTVSCSGFLDHQISCPENFCSIKPFAISSDTNKNTEGSEKTALHATQSASDAVSSVTGFSPLDIKSSRQDSCCTSNRSDSPDIDIVDEVTFHSFSSKRSLQHFVRSNAQNRSRNGAHNTIGAIERRCSNSIVHHWGKHRRIWPNRHTSSFTSSRRLHEQLQLGLIRPITAPQFEQLKLHTTAAPKIRRSALSSNLRNYRLQERKKECQRIVPKNVPSKITVQQRALPECRVVVNKPSLLCSPSSENTAKLSSRSRRDTKGLRLLRVTLSLATQSLEALREPRFVNSVPCNEPGCRFGCICRLFANNTFSQLVGSSVDSPSYFSISNLQLKEIGYTGRLSLSALNKPVCDSSASYNSRCSTPLSPNDDIQCEVSSSVSSMKKNICSASRLRKKSSVRKVVKSVSRRKQKKQSVRQTSETEPGQLRSCIRTKSVVSCVEQTSVGLNQVRNGMVTVTPAVQQSVRRVNEMRTPTRDTSVKNQHLSPKKTISSAQQSDDDCMIIDNPEPSTICRTPTRRKSIKELIAQNKTVNVGAPSVSTRSSPRKFASLFNDNGWKSRSVQRRGYGLAFRNIRPTLRINNSTPAMAVSAPSTTQLSSVVSSRSTKSPSTANRNLATNPQSFISCPSPVKVRSSQPKIKSAPFRTQMVLFQHSSRNPASGNDGVGKRRGRPCLLEITSNCEWEKVRAKILTQLAGVTIDSTSYPKTCRLLVEGFHVEILPQTDHPTALPEHLHAAVGCPEMVPIRIRITVEAKTPTLLTATRISVLQQGKLVPVCDRSAVRDLLLSNNGIRSLVGKIGGGQQLFRGPVGQLLQNSCDRLEAYQAASSDNVSASCVDTRPVPPAAISESDASVADTQRDHRNVTVDVCGKQDGDCDGHSNSDKHIEQHSSAAASTESSNNCLHLP